MRQTSKLPNETLWPALVPCNILFSLYFLLWENLHGENYTVNIGSSSSTPNKGQDEIPAFADAF